MHQPTAEHLRKKQRAKQAIFWFNMFGCLFWPVIGCLLALSTIGLFWLYPATPWWLAFPMWIVPATIGFIAFLRYLQWVKRQELAWLKQYGLLITAQVDTCELHSDEGPDSYDSQVHSLPESWQPREYRFMVTTEKQYEVGQLIQIWVDPEDLSFYSVDHPQEK